MIRQLEVFMSVNSAVEVDLFGQVNAEMAGGRQISGTGGGVDLCAAKASGRSLDRCHERDRSWWQRVANSAQGEIVTALRQMSIR